MDKVRELRPVVYPSYCVLNQRDLRACNAQTAVTVNCRLTVTYFNINFTQNNRLPICSDSLHYARYWVPAAAAMLQDLRGHGGVVIGKYRYVYWEAVTRVYMNTRPCTATFLHNVEARLIVTNQKKTISPVLYFAYTVDTFGKKITSNFKFQPKSPIMKWFTVKF
jgi:PPE-repeat protein